MAGHIDWDSLRIFLACSRTGSLRAAADQLCVNHATVRRSIGALEERLGTRLFDRSVGGLVLTQPGETLQVHAEEMEQHTADIERKLAGIDSSPSGSVRVSIPTSLAHSFLAPILAGFTQAHPDIEVEVIATNQISNLGRYEADVSIRVAFEVEDDVVGRRAVRYVDCAYAAPAYLDQHPDLTVGDGTGAHWIGWTKNKSWIKASPFPNASQRHYLPEVFMQMEAAAQGLGMVQVPCFLADGDTRLVRIPGVKPTPNRSIWILLHGDLRRTARVRAFVDHTAKYIDDNRSLFTT